MDPMVISSGSLHGVATGERSGGVNQPQASNSNTSGSNMAFPFSSPNAAGSGGSQASGDSANNAVMNDKVQALAGTIYEEFEAMMSNHGPEVLKNLMPLIVNVLESLDLAYTENQEMEVEIELLKEDNEQLVTQYEREKGLRKTADQRNLEMEDSFEGDRKENTMKIESLSSIVKMFELKAKNSQDQIGRLEEKENEMKKEYSKLHERYTELFKTHIDYMERTKSMIGAERLEQMQGLGSARNKIPGSLTVNNQFQRSSGPVSFGFSELENNNASVSQLPSLMTPSTPFENKAGGGAASTLKNELQTPSKESAAQQKGDKSGVGRTGGWMGGVTPSSEKPPTRPGDLEIQEAEDISQDPSVGPATPMQTSTSTIGGHSHTKSETRTGNNLYQELSFQDSEAIVDVDEGADITGMGKEVENLIAENNELLATKNALNIVKDDLIAKVDELTGEHEILREEIKSLQNIRTRLEKKVQEQDEYLKKVKEDAEAAAKAAKSDDEEDVPMAQRKRFTRVEMARVLMERNQFKEKYMELQEALRYSQMLMAVNQAKDGSGGGVGTPGTPGAGEKQSRWGIRKFFGNLFSGTQASGEDQQSSGNLGPYLHMKYSGNAGSSAGGENVTPALSTMRARSTAERKARGGGTAAADYGDGPDATAAASVQSAMTAMNIRAPPSSAQTLSPVSRSPSQILAASPGNVSNRQILVSSSLGNVSSRFSASNSSTPSQTRKKLSSAASNTSTPKKMSLTNVEVVDEIATACDEHTIMNIEDEEKEKRMN